MGILKYPTQPRYSVLARAFGEQTRELYPKACWDDVSGELEALWKSYVTGLGWSEVCEQVRMAWEAADPRLADDATYGSEHRS